MNELIKYIYIDTMDNDFPGGKYHALCTEVQYADKQIRLGYLPAFISPGPISQNLG